MPWPKSIPGPSSCPESRWELIQNCHARRLHAGEPAPIQTLLVLEEQKIVVLPDAWPSALAADILPVYQLRPDGPRAVPTGRVFLRFTEERRADASRAAMEQAGYTVDMAPR